MSTKGGIVNSNFSSADNPLAHGGMQRYQPTVASQQSTSNNKITKPQPTGGGVVKSNFSSADNPLVNPSYSHEAQELRKTQQASLPKITQTAQANPGGLVKSNVSSSDNPFANPSYDMPSQINSVPNTNPEQWRKINTYEPAPKPYEPSQKMYEPSSSSSNGPYFPQTMSADSILPPISSQPTSSSIYFPSLDAYNKANNQTSYVPSTPETYYPVNPNKPSYSYNDEPSLLNYSSIVRNDRDRIDAAPPSFQDNYPKTTLPKSPLDTLVAEKSDQEVNRFLEEKNRQRMEQELFDQQYPLARRTSIINDLKKVKPDSMQTTYNSSYQGFSNTSNVFPRLSKDMIVEKPNSLSADVPPYDPIKYKNGLEQGYNYDPWGKPGGGAPLIDPTTGRKFTKISGQVWYDTLGMSPDDRAKLYLDKNRPLTLEEQKYEMELEKERKRYEEAVYKSRAGDVATWISDLENARANKVKQNAHLQHTNVTREKINVEYARRANLNEATKTYHDELQTQLEERERELKLHKLRDNIAGIEHVKRWDDWWGKPGGGAPNPERRRHNLEAKLEEPQGFLDRNQSGSLNTLPIMNGRNYSNMGVDGPSYLFSKQGKSSTHKNLYDNLQPMK